MSAAPADPWGGRVAICPFDERVFEASVEWLADDELRTMIDARPSSLAESRVWFEGLEGRSDYRIWAMSLDGRPVGAFGLKNIADGQGEYWGYIGEKNLWGRGLGTPMLQTAIDQARRIGLTRVWLRVRWANTRALRLYLRHGFIIDAVEMPDHLRMARVIGEGP